ncbi:MAG: class I adenylate-forming enzyme family protein [Paracoccaceae bacterium]
MLSIFDQGPPPPCPVPFNLAAHVLGPAAANANKTALSILHRDGTENWTYSQLEQAVLGTASGLQNMGLDRGARVLMRIGNSVDFPIAYLGCIAAGFVPIPTSTQLTELEVSAIISDISPAAILRDPSVACPDHDLTLSTSDLRTFYQRKPSPDSAPYDYGDPNRLAYIVYTSGTSGKPRAVAHAHRAVWARQMMLQGWYDLRHDDRLLHAGAFNWTYTLGTGLLDPWTLGATSLIPGNGCEHGDIPRMISEQSATIFAAAPGVYRKILMQNKAIEGPVLRHGLSAGEKLPLRLRNAWRAATGTEVYEAYGMSECSTFISSSPTSPARGGGLGAPQVGRRVAVLDDSGPVKISEEGTIAIHRDDPGLMLGYLNAPAETADRMQGDWFLTGDQGAMSADGQITYLGRADDMMNAGGYRVSPLEVEAALSGFPGIDAIGVTDVLAKQDVRIVAAFYTGAKVLDDDALRRYAQNRLARYKQPRVFVHLPNLPTGPNGKLLRRALRANFEASDDKT